MAGIRTLHAYAVKNAETVKSFTLRKRDDDGASCVVKLNARPDVSRDGVTTAAVRAAALKCGGSASFKFPLDGWDGADPNLTLMGDKLAELIDRGTATADPPADEKPARKPRFSTNGTPAADPAPAA